MLRKDLIVVDSTTYCVNVLAIPPIQRPPVAPLDWKRISKRWWGSKYFSIARSITLDMPKTASNTRCGKLNGYRGVLYYQRVNVY